MNKTKSVVLLLCIFLLGFFLGWFYASDEEILVKGETESVLVTQIVDGDTIAIEGGDRVRLLGIDTPERGEDYYAESKQYLEDRILMKRVELEKSIEDRGTYGRLLRYVWLDDSLINAELVEKGLALAYFYDENEKYVDLIAEAEQNAIENKIGIWGKLN